MKISSMYLRFVNGTKFNHKILIILFHIMASITAANIDFKLIRDKMFKRDVKDIMKNY